MRTPALCRATGLAAVATVLGVVVTATPAYAKTGSTMSYLSGNATSLSSHCRTYGWSSSKKVTIDCSLYLNGNQVEHASRSGKGSASTPTWVISCPVPGDWETQALGPAGQDDHSYLTIG